MHPRQRSVPGSLHHGSCAGFRNLTILEVSLLNALSHAYNFSGPCNEEN